MLHLALKLMRHRVFWRFLAVLSVSLGYASLGGDLSKLEVAFCSVLTCSD